MIPRRGRGTALSLTVAFALVSGVATGSASADTYPRVTFCGQCLPARSERMLDEDIIAAHWLTLEEIRARSDQLRSPLVLRSIDDYLRQKRYPLELLVDLDGDEGA